jgi:hypothetical protein
MSLRCRRRSKLNPRLHHRRDAALGAHEQVDLTG